MTAYMYDGAYQPDLAECRRRGAVAMSHYLTRSYAATSAQPRAIRAAGMGVVLNWEGQANELVGATRAQGQRIGREILGSLDPMVPRDGTVAIYCSVDVAVYGAPYSDCDAAFTGLNDVLRPAGFQVRTYAEGAVIDHLLSRGLVQGKQWLSMSESFPGFDAHSQNVCLIQMHDAAGHWIGTDIPGTDRNTVTDPHALGAWWPTGHPYAQEPDMPLTEAEMVHIADLAADRVWGRKIRDIDSGGVYTAAQYLQGTYRDAHRNAGELVTIGKAVATIAAQMTGVAQVVHDIKSSSVAIDTAAVAADIKARLIHALGGQ